VGRILQVGGQRWTPNVAALSGGFYDDFSGAAPAAFWTTLLGTLATNSGALRASTLASDGYEKVTNGTMEADANWASLSSPVTNARSNEQAHAGIYSRKIVGNAGATSGCYQAVTAIAGATYAIDGYIYPVDGVGRLSWDGTTIDTSTGTGAWDLLASTRVFASNTTLYLNVNAGVTAYYDDISIHLQLAGLTVNLGTPNAVVTASVKMPAALTTPRALYLRGTNALNYTCLRIDPNTAGNDTTLSTVVAGVRTAIGGAVADVDWTANGTDKIRVTVQGNSYAVEHMKSGASSWTTAFTATDATGNTNTLFGPMVWAAADNSFDDILIQAA
jgi:hypothetical protein